VRILVITDWTANEGGIEAYVGRATRVLRSAGHDARVLTSSAGSPGPEQADYVALGADNPVAKTFLQIANPLAMARVRAVIREFRPDVVQVNMFEQYLSPGIFAALGGVPTVALVHYAKPVCPTALKLLPDGTLCEVPAGLVCWRGGCVGLAEWLRDRPRYALIRGGLTRAARVLACSRWMAEQLRVNGIAAEPIALPVPPPGPEYRRAPSREPVFLYCGRLNWEKGVDLLLHAFARVRVRHRAARLRILGGGARQPVLVELAARLGLGDAVSFEGRVPFERVEAALGQAWAMLAPSIWPEPLGLTAIEAITRGVPAIVSAAGGLGETVQDGISGSLVPNGDEAALADSLMAAVDRGPVEVPEDVVAALRLRHDPARHGAALTTVFREAIGDRRS